jgi:excisionase family DNA binding protein
MTDHALLTVKEVAEKLGITTFRVYRRIQRGDLKTTPARRGNVQFLIHPDDLQDYIDAGGEDILSSPRPSGDAGWITTGEAAQRTGLTMETIRAMCYSGRLLFTRGSGFGGRIHVSSASIDELLS